MEISQTSIIGFLGGSLLTLAIKEIINWFTKRMEYQREIRKLTYVRKLDVAEKIMAHYIVYVQRLGVIKILLDEWVEQLKKLNVIGLNQMNDYLAKYGKELEELDKLSLDNRNAAYLYFDIDHLVQWAEHHNRLGYGVLIKVQSIADRFAGLEKKLAENPAFREEFRKEMGQIIAEVAMEFKKLSMMCDVQKKEMLQLVKSVKEQLK